MCQISAWTFVLFGQEGSDGANQPFVMLYSPSHAARLLFNFCVKYACSGLPSGLMSAAPPMFRMGHPCVLGPSPQLKMRPRLPHRSYWYTGLTVAPPGVFSSSHAAMPCSPSV